MLEMKLTIEAPELANALNNLAAALGEGQAGPFRRPGAVRGAADHLRPGGGN